MRKQFGLGKTLFFLVAASCGFGLVGCLSSTDSHEHAVYPHKPKDFKEAVVRLSDIHGQLVSDQPLPEPREFVVPGHTHHHSDHEHAHDHSHDDGHNHGHTHQHGDDRHHGHGHSHGHEIAVKVDISQEWIDIVRWLPSVAADSDLPKKSWDSVNQQCRKLSQLANQIAGDTPTDFRAAYQQRATEIEQALNALQESLSDYEYWDNRFPG